MLPETFNRFGLLPPKDYMVTFGELRRSLLVRGPKNKRPTWDEKWRRSLVNNLELMVRQLWSVGISRVFVNGSFVENKDHPNDIDGYFECDVTELATGRLERDLNLLDPNKAWTWAPESCRLDANSAKRQLPMWHIYRVELYPHYRQVSGIMDKFGNQLMFPAAFRQSRREFRQKGIVGLKKK